MHQLFSKNIVSDENEYSNELTIRCYQQPYSGSLNDERRSHRELRESVSYRQFSKWAFLPASVEELECGHQWPGSRFHRQPSWRLKRCLQDWWKCKIPDELFGNPRDYARLSLGYRPRYYQTILRFRWTISSISLVDNKWMNKLPKSILFENRMRIRKYIAIIIQG